jgi:PhnB protein
MSLMEKDLEVTFIPSLYLVDVGAAMEFYEKCFGATERWRIENDNGTIHVAEMTLGNVKFRMHENGIGNANVDGGRKVVVLGLLVKDPEGLAARAVKAGADLVSPVKLYEYGYRQGTLIDPFGHYWCIEGVEGLTMLPLIR